MSRYETRTIGSGKNRAVFYIGKASSLMLDADIGALARAIGDGPEKVAYLESMRAERGKGFELLTEALAHLDNEGIERTVLIAGSDTVPRDSLVRFYRRAGFKFSTPSESRSDQPIMVRNRS